MAPHAAHVIPLNTDFRFIHEPLDCTSAAHASRFVGRNDELEELVARIVLSDGGAFLVTGYRGVGKSTFINRVIEQVRTHLRQSDLSREPIQFVDVHLNVPRVMDAVELMYHVLRGLYLRLSALGLLDGLDPSVRRDLELAFERTSRTIALKTSSALENTAGVNLGAPAARVLQGTAGFSFGTKRSLAASRDIAYLAYDDKAAEYDLVHIARRLAHGYLPQRRWIERWWGRLLGAAPSRRRLKVLLVFDELDKIDDANLNSSSIDGILGNLKTLFTTSGISFLFVAGKDIHDRWMDDVGRGDSIYESVFSYALYLPPLWMHADPMCDPLLDGQAFSAVDAAETATAYAAFKKFLAFNGRGIPRRILRKFNERVRWNSSRAQLILSRDDVRQFRFFADLYDVLTGAESILLGELREDAWTGRTDRKRLGLYYLTDWILLRGVDEFTLGDAVAASKRLSHLIAPAEEAAPAIIDRLLTLLVQRNYLEIVVSTMPEGSAASEASRYRLTHQRLVEMGSLEGVVEQEAQALINESKQERFGGRYEVLSVLGRGGMSTVFLANDRMLRRQVAIKEQLTGLEDPAARDRIRTESQALSRLQHENIVRVFDVHADAKPPYIVMEYVKGRRLTDVIGATGMSSEGDVLNIAHQVVRALRFVHDSGILWRDPKPANIMITPEGRAVLLDFGISHLLTGSDRDAGFVVATPMYASPEQLRGEPLDVRSDIYCIGVILYQMVSGKAPFGSEISPAAIARRAAPPPPLDQGLAVSKQLADAIFRCLEPDRERRFQSAGELLAALPTPETPAKPLPDAVEPSPDQPSSDVPDARTQVVRIADTAEPAPVPVPADPIESASLIDSSGTSHALSPPLVRIGRARGNDLTLPGSTVSRFHAELRWSRNGWTLSDLNSRYGTTLNRTAVTAPVLLRHQDIIRVGTDPPDLVFHAGAAPVGATESGAPRVRRVDLDDFVAELRELAASAPLDRVFEYAVDRAIELTRTERGFVMTADGGSELVIKAARARGGIPLPGSVFETSQKLPREVLATGEMRVVTDLFRDYATDDLGTARLGIRQVLCLPLVVRRSAKPLGVLYLDSRERAAVQSQSVRDALQILAVELAHAIQGTRTETVEQEPRQLEQKTRLGVEQQALIGDVERNGSYYQAVGRSMPSGRFGGDFILCWELAEQCVAFAIGDVAGIGAPAAQQASLITRFIRDNAKALSKPSNLISALNRTLIVESGAARYATVFYGQLDSTGRLTYCNSGHNAPLILHGRETRRLEVHGLPVGLFGEAPYADSELMLSPDDLVVCFSDGVSEAMNAAGEEFSEQRLIRLATEKSHATVAEFIGTVFQQLSDFTSAATLLDDATMLVVRFTPNQSV